MAVGSARVQDAHRSIGVMTGDTVAKPARTVKVGDVVKVRKPPVTYSFKVLALTENRLGARLVPEYMENVTPKSELDLLDVVRISGFIDRRKGLGRPTKREGRQPCRGRLRRRHRRKHSRHHPQRPRPLTRFFGQP